MLRSPSAGALPHSSTSQTKFVQERIRTVEKHFGELCTALAEYTLKIAGQRDKGDILAEVLQNFAAAENVHKSCTKGIKDFADCIALISDYRDLSVHRLEETVIDEISTYENLCKSTFEDVRNCHAAYEKEIAHHKYVNKLRQQNPLGRMQITKAESDLQQAAAQSIRLGKSLEERVDKLEKKKLDDLKVWLMRIALIEMSFHSTALSILSNAYGKISSIDVDSDHEEFRSVMRSYQPLNESSTPTRAQSVPVMAPVATPSYNENPKPKRSKSFSDYRLQSESLDSLKVQEYEEVHEEGITSDESNNEDDEETEEESSDDNLFQTRKKR